MLPLLNESTPSVRRFLGEALPQVSREWWNVCVVFGGGAAFGSEIEWDE
jgi:hypothetical protein